MFFFLAAVHLQLSRARSAAEMMGLDGKRGQSVAQVSGLKRGRLGWCARKPTGLHCVDVTGRFRSLRRCCWRCRPAAWLAADWRTGWLAAQEHCTPSGNYMIGAFRHNRVWHVSQGRYYFAQLAWQNYYKRFSSVPSMMGRLSRGRNLKLNNKPSLSRSRFVDMLWKWIWPEVGWMPAVWKLSVGFTRD